MSKLYVDGCSYTYAQGLDRTQSVGARFNADLDLCRPGKSNMGIVMDLYPNIDKYDEFILGFTYPSRYTFYNNNEPIDVQPTKNHLGRLKNNILGKFVEDTYPMFARVLWSLNNDKKMTDLSTFCLAGAISLLKERNKKYVIYSWLPYNVKDDNYFIPTIPNSIDYRISKDDSHFNEHGMQMLEDQIRVIYDKK